MNTGNIKKGEDQGAIHIRRHILLEENEQVDIAQAITHLAGVVGENMYLLGTNSIWKKKEKIIADPTIMDWSTGGGDIPAFWEDVFGLALSIVHIDPNKVRDFCLRFLIDFLCNKEIWYMVEKLCDELLATDGMKLNEEELELAFAQIGLDALLDNDIRREYQKQVDEFLHFWQWH